MLDCLLEFPAVVLNMFQNVDVDDRIELFFRREIGQNPTDSFIFVGLALEAVFELSNQVAIRFQADEPSQVAAIQVGSVAADPGADFQDIACYKPAYFGRPIGLPAMDRRSCLPAHVPRRVADAPVSGGG